jgi:hypothetical protein
METKQIVQEEWKGMKMKTKNISWLHPPIFVI